MEKWLVVAFMVAAGVIDLILVAYKNRVPASPVVSQFWRNFPLPPVIVVVLAICAFAFAGLWAVFM